MALQFTIDIADEDFPFFLEAVQRAEQRASGKSAQEIVAAAEATFVSAQDAKMPEFVRSRVSSVENLIAMVRDEGWALSDEDRSRVVGALTYFADPEDLIPDNIPVLGFLDDAAVLAWVLGQVRAELYAFRDWEQQPRLDATGPASPTPLQLGEPDGAR